MFDERLYLFLLLRHECWANTELHRNQIKNPVFGGNWVSLRSKRSSEFNKKILGKKYVKYLAILTDLQTWTLFTSFILLFVAKCLAMMGSVIALADFLLFFNPSR